MLYRFLACVRGRYVRDAFGRGRRTRAVFSLLLRNFAVILAASAVFGVSFMLFEVKWLPSAARRTFHILLLYADLIIAFLLMANVSGDTSGQVLFVFMATLIFIVLYGVSCIVSSVIRKRRGK